MRKFLLLAPLTILAVSGLSAAVVPCPTSTTLDILLGFNSLANACSSQDKLFWNFNYTPGANAPAASGVTSSLIFQQGQGIDIHGWNFGGNWSQAGSVLGSFTLGYTIQVCPVATCSSTVPGTVINLADATYAPSAVSTPGPETVNWSNGATVTLTSASPGPLPGNGNIGLGAGITTPISVTAAFSGTGAITQTSLRFYESIPTTVPEPTSAALFFGGLAMIVFGCCRRNKSGRVI